MKKIAAAFAGMALLLQPTPARAIDPASKTALSDGLNALYNLDYDRARALFASVEKSDPEDPLGAYAVTTALWWELTNEFDENNPALEKEFLAAVERTAKTASNAVKRGDPQGHARLALGGALGLKGRWDAIRGHWWAAYRDGKKAYRYQSEAIEDNPGLYDAYLGVGIFHYYTATLPGVVRALAGLLIARGDRERGLSEIKLAMEKGDFSRTAARLFLVGIFLNNEKRPGDALSLVRELRNTEYPQSSFFHLLEMLSLERIEDWTGVRAQAEDYLTKIKMARPSYRSKYRHRARLLLGNASLAEERPEAALEEYNRALAETKEQDRWLSLVHLNKGKALDVLGRRDEALKSYREVLKHRDVWELHDQAESFIREPYPHKQSGKR